MQKIDIKERDFMLIIYFTMLRYYYSSGTTGSGTSSKRDQMGGFIDRWVNYMAPMIVLNPLLKKYKKRIISDYHLYDRKAKKNAPDVIGIEDKNGKISDIFSKFKDGDWVHVDNKPFIEVKAPRGDQYMIGLNETQMHDDHYYCYVETSLNDHYIAYLFEDKAFGSDLFKAMRMNEIFIESDKHNSIIKPEPVIKPKNIGTMRLIGTYTGKELKKHTEVFKPKEGVYYLRNIQKVEEDHFNRYFKSKTGEWKTIHLSKKSEKYEYKIDVRERFLPFLIKSSISKFCIRDTYNGNPWKKPCIMSEVPFNLNGNNFEAGIYKLNFSFFERTSGWTEYIGNKDIFDVEKNSIFKSAPNDCTEDLIKKLI